MHECGRIMQDDVRKGLGKDVCTIELWYGCGLNDKMGTGHPHEGVGGK